MNNPLLKLITDGPARRVIAEMFRAWTDDLADLFRERRIRELRASLRALLLLTEAVAAVEAKAGGVNPPS